MSSHILSDVESLADRVAILDGGKLKRVVDMRELEGVGAAKVVRSRQLGQRGLERLRHEGFEPTTRGDVSSIVVEDEENLPRVLQIIHSEGGKLLRVEALRSSLEDVFLAEIGLGGPQKRRQQAEHSSSMRQATDEVVEAVRDVQEVH